MEIGEIEKKKVILTNHALVRFSERIANLNKGQEPKKPIKTISRLFQQAKEETMRPRGRLKRLLDNHCIEARYFIFEGWRFVLVEVEDRYDVVTIERDLFAI